jgi:hypothetical protein
MREMLRLRLAFGRTHRDGPAARPYRGQVRPPRQRQRPRRLQWAAIAGQTVATRSRRPARDREEAGGRDGLEGCPQKVCGLLAGLLARRQLSVVLSRHGRGWPNPSRSWEDWPGIGPPDRRRCRLLDRQRRRAQRRRLVTRRRTRLAERQGLLLPGDMLERARWTSRVWPGQRGYRPARRR